MNVLAAGRLIAKLHCVDNNLHPRFHRHQFISSQSVFCFFFFFLPAWQLLWLHCWSISIHHSHHCTVQRDRCTSTSGKTNKMLMFGDEGREIRVNNYSPVIKWDHPGAASLCGPSPSEISYFNRVETGFHEVFRILITRITYKHGIRYK